MSLDIVHCKDKVPPGGNRSTAGPSILVFIPPINEYQIRDLIIYEIFNDILGRTFSVPFNVFTYLLAVGTLVFVEQRL